MPTSSDYPVRVARVEVELSLVWCENHPELADAAVKKFFDEYGGPACERRFDFSRKGTLLMIADMKEPRGFL